MGLPVHLAWGEGVIQEVFYEEEELLELGIPVQRRKRLCLLKESFTEHLLHARFACTGSKGKEDRWCSGRACNELMRM